MTSLRPRADHQDAVSRRLASLTADIASTRPRQPPVAEAEDDAWLAGHTRIRPLRAVPEPAHGPDPPWVGVRPGAPPVPTPGRHAARRRGTPLLPEALRGRVALGPTQLVVVAVLVAVGIAVTGWWVVRGDPERLEAPRAPVSSGRAGAALSGASAPLADAAPTASGAAAAPAGAAKEVTVDVTGKVRHPGIVVLDLGSRVVDAVESAGGPRRGVSLSSLNLARVLVDGEQIVVGGPPAPTAGAAAAAGAPAPGGPMVNLNTATESELETLPEVGPVTAQSIVAWRTEHGGFSSVDELLEVDGIGDATLAKIAPHATI
ncbi:helix-hairpin-helix domain-containing protein [Nocardioides sp. URHA0020]|uniref:helix-hairpin-helix domain-containing protein n=1 Tax=Nocardioides sp. URHA0020 TaxID=1380392 RepID=UPI0009DDA2C5|nr:helix-hairpin-helix domain-containing protein [Nocardioides sp. URHA0020]